MATSSPLPVAWAVKSKKIDTPVMTGMDLRARCSPQLAFPPHLHRASLLFAWLVRPGVPVSPMKRSHRCPCPEPYLPRTGCSPPSGPSLTSPSLSLFALPLNLLPSLTHLNAGPVAVAAVDGAGCEGSVSTPACIECMGVGVGRYLSAAPSVSAGFVAPSVSVSVAEVSEVVVEVEEVAAAV